MRRSYLTLALVCLVLPLCLSSTLADRRSGNPATTSKSSSLAAVLWRQPHNIPRLDLYYGPGGRAHYPKGNFRFEKEILSGTNPKFDVIDATGVKWKVKLGSEAQPETVVDRLLWAAGYYTDEDYFLPRIQVSGLPKLKRGKEYVSRNGVVYGARLKRHPQGEKNVGTWRWEDNPFVGTREYDGLRVMMALTSNWDLKPDNNKIAAKKGRDGETAERIYYVSDLGATLGSTGSVLRKIIFFADLPAGSKGDPDDYAEQRFIDGVRHGYVVFHYKGKDPGALKGVSVANARWLGHLVGQLSNRQIADAFRAGGYRNPDLGLYVSAVRARIRRLEDLR